MVSEELTALAMPCKLCPLGLFHTGGKEHSSLQGNGRRASLHHQCGRRAHLHKVLVHGLSPPPGGYRRRHVLLLPVLILVLIRAATILCVLNIVLLMVLGRGCRPGGRGSHTPVVLMGKLDVAQRSVLEGHQRRHAYGQAERSCSGEKRSLTH